MYYTEQVINELNRMNQTVSLLKQINNFLPEDIYQELKQHCLDCEFSNITNPIDGVTYPDINIELSDNVKQSVINAIEDVLGLDIAPNPLMFLRMSKLGTPCNHIHHHDGSHGTHSLMLYTNDNIEGGTSLVRHRETGCTYAPESQSFVDYLIEDMNQVDKWVSQEKSDMKQNTAVIFDANLFHRAEPVGGFGLTQDTARIVLTCFFSVESL